jgi:hypothetical protein
MLRAGWSGKPAARIETRQKPNSNIEKEEDAS